VSKSVVYRNRHGDKPISGSTKKAVLLCVRGMGANLGENPVREDFENFERTLRDFLFMCFLREMIFKVFLGDMIYLERIYVHWISLNRATI
jgi:hypothetical protein